jgi:hypothetical protein
MLQTGFASKSPDVTPKLPITGLAALFLTYFLASSIVYGLNVAAPMIAARQNKALQMDVYTRVRNSHGSHILYGDLQF